MTGSKIIKSGGAEPDEFEKQIAQALLELEMNSDLRQQLRELNITRAREIEFGAKKVSINFCIKSNKFNIKSHHILGNRHLCSSSKTKGFPKSPNSSCP